MIWHYLQIGAGMFVSSLLFMRLALWLVEHAPPENPDPE